jgi:hypothetical protein
MKLPHASLTTLRLLFVCLMLTAWATLAPRQSAAEKRQASFRFALYGEIPRSAESTKLNGYARELRANKGAQGYIITYGGKDSAEDMAQERADRAKDYLVTVREIDAGRLVTVDGGYKEEPATELWIVPAGATPPTASPTVERSDRAEDSSAGRGEPGANLLSTERYPEANRATPARLRRRRGTSRRRSSPPNRRVRGSRLGVRRRA